MENRWSDTDAQKYADRYTGQWGEDLALRTYTARLIGREPSLVLHGGGNTSVKSTASNLLGESVRTLFVKASGFDLAEIEPAGHCGLELEPLLALRSLDQLTDRKMVALLRRNLLETASPNPSIEALVHAFLPPKFLDHTHADAILALTNRPDPKQIIREALGDDVVVLDYVEPGFDLARTMAQAFEENPGKKGAVWIQHGLITWGESAQESYESTIELVNRAERYLAENRTNPLRVVSRTDPAIARRRWACVAPVLRGLLAGDSGNPDRPYERIILTPLQSRKILDFVDSDRGKETALTPPLTTDHLIRTKPLPAWIDDPDFENPEAFRSQVRSAVEQYREQYRKYLERHVAKMDQSLEAFDPTPRVMLIPGLGAACAGRDIREAVICRDITAQTLEVKSRIAACGEYRGLEEDRLFAMEYRTLQHAKLNRREPALGRETALVTGAAGAIGSGICRGLLEAGCHVVATDLAGDPLETLVKELQVDHGDRIMGVPMDVTDPASVGKGWAEAIRQWGGVDIVIVNAGIALVSSLKEMDLEAFRRLERVNTEGTLLVFSEAARHFELQNTGGDVILISTKNVFAPGANFGAYSATKAASHQLARIASLEMAPIGVRVNMVSPDAVFGAGDRKSGLWQEVGPDRMRARGLDEHGLQEYYRKRNLLKSPVTARHVANAVLFFATRQTPTTGATIPVDGGLPDSTPR